MNEKGLLAELTSLGLTVDSVDDLYNTEVDYRLAIQVLIRALPRLEDQREKESVVRALSVSWAKPAAGPVLLEQFRTVHDEGGLGIRWSIANAPSVVATDAIFDDLAVLVRDRAYGRSREMLAVALGRCREAPAEPLLIELLDDEQIAGHALMALAARRAKVPSDVVGRFLGHPQAWVRKYARRLRDMSA